MRLINTTTLQLEEFDYPGTPPYAILSHTWGDGELTYHDVQDCTRTPQNIRGWLKLQHTARQAAIDGLRYCWVDTCCIDKANYSELSEAINSMYNWYKEAQRCYAYLEDVEHGDNVSELDSGFRKSRWFTRGWTLQELIAPTELAFYNRQWEHIGQKKDLPKTLSEITRIPQRFLLGDPLWHASVAQRMSWVSRRRTTKPEDIAYCLMGIFDVHMPLLYGEREAAAFQRLQQEILKESDDTSIFAWRASSNGFDPDILANQTYALLARSPQLFDQSHNIVETDMPVVAGYVKGIRTPITLDNKGLHLSLPLNVALKGPTQVILGCRREGKSREHIAIWVRDVSANGGRYVRICGFELSNISLVSIHQSFEYRDLNTERRVFALLPRVLLQDHLGPGHKELETVVRSVYSAASRHSAVPPEAPLDFMTPAATSAVALKNFRGDTASAPADTTNARKRPFTAYTL